MKAEDVMVHDVVTVEPQTSIADAVKLLMRTPLANCESSRGFRAHSERGRASAVRPIQTCSGWAILRGYGE